MCLSLIIFFCLSLYVCLFLQDLVFSEPWIKRMTIDEGIHKIKRKNETDHSTICIDIKINGIEKQKIVKKTDWNLRASNDKWASFGDLLEESSDTATSIITDHTIPFNTRYKQWYKVLDNAARNI